MISIYSKKTETELNMRRLEAIDKYNKVIQWGRREPTRFIEEIFKIQLIDYQKWVILNTWAAEQACWVCSRNAGKSFLGGVYIMARSLLFPKHETYIMSNTAAQSRDTFLKLENIAKKKIGSLLGASDVFYNELVKNNANMDGFTHIQGQCACELYNGSKITSLVGKAENIVGKRSNLNFYDEAGKIDHQFFALTKPFTTQNSDFKTGIGFDSKVYPLNVPTQNIYASSAEGVDSYLWTQYVDCAKNMMMGIPGYFCADINCDLPLKPYINGIESPALLKQSEIDSAMRTNESRALREYYNIFDVSGGTNAAVSRAAILRNERNYLPKDRSEGEDKHYVFCYDPALQADNSFILISEVFKDKELGWKARVVNGINLIEALGPTEKRILTVPEQLDWIHKLMLMYNNGAVNWENIDLWIDGGTGGHGPVYADYLILDWEDSSGNRYPGLIDTTYEKHAQERQKYPRAIDRLRLVEPKANKTQMYVALGELMEQGMIELPPALPMNRELQMEDGSVKHLTMEEVRALLEIDLAKEEMMAMQKTKTTSGNVVFKLPPTLEKKMHDDRSYTFALLAGYLSDLRRGDRPFAEQPKESYAEYLAAMAAQKRDNTPLGRGGNPFANRNNPFGRR